MPVAGAVSIHVVARLQKNRSRKQNGDHAGNEDNELLVAKAATATDPKRIGKQCQRHESDTDQKNGQSCCSRDTHDIHLSAIIDGSTVQLMKKDRHLLRRSWSLARLDNGAPRNSLKSIATSHPVSITYRESRLDRYRFPPVYVRVTSWMRESITRWGHVQEGVSGTEPRSRTARQSAPGLTERMRQRFRDRHLHLHTRGKSRVAYAGNRSGKAHHPGVSWWWRHSGVSF